MMNYTTRRPRGRSGVDVALRNTTADTSATDGLVRDTAANATARFLISNSRALPYPRGTSMRRCWGRMLVCPESPPMGVIGYADID